MIPQGWVDATDLNLWANRRDAQSSLPQLVRRLVHATIEQIQRINFPAGDSVQMGGWDGIVCAMQDNAFVPAGYSVWEFGVTRDIKGKADSDYHKRSTKPLNITPAETTFIFVTLRRWGKKDDWVHEKNKEGIWAEVRAYDADDLEQWLELAPAVHTWLAKLIGKWSEDAQDLGSFWEEWTQATIPVLSSELHLASRKEAIEAVINWLNASPSKLTIQADSTTEAIAFFAAVLHQMPEEEQIQHLSRCVLARTEATWRYISNAQDGLILVPTFGLPKSLPKGHHVLIPVGKENSVSKDILQLNRLERASFQQALMNMGLSLERAYELTKESKRSLSILRRLLAGAPELHTPEWAKLENARCLIPTLLIGAWDDAQEADRQVLADLARKPYEEAIADIIRWRNCSDPFVRQVGSIWQVMSREDAWHLLCQFLLRDDLEAFKAVVHSVLNTLDPRYDLPPDQRFAASIYGKVLPYSGYLREGLADTLAYLATRTHPDRVQDTAPVQYRVNVIVRQLLVDEADWQRWASLAPYLPTLAEAAPEVFLEVVNQDLEKDAPAILGLFVEEGTMGSSPHVYLLWALEGLAWQVDYLSQVALILAKLSRLEPGGKLLNRPYNSLKAIFQRLAPQTNAGLEQRLRVLDTLLLREPEIAWQLLCSLLPSNRNGGEYTHQPRWRDWRDDKRPKVTDLENFQTIDAFTDRVLSKAGTNSEKWCNVIESIAYLPVQTKERVIDALQALNTRKLPDVDLASIWNRLRAIVHKHREFSETQWAMPAAVVDRLYSIYQQFEPQDLIHRYAWIFQSRPDFVTSRQQTWEESLEATRQAQAEAAKEVYSQGGVCALLRLAEQVKEPRLLGEASAKIDNVDEAEVALLKSALIPNQLALNTLALGFVAQRQVLAGWEWVNKLLSVGKTEQWSNQDFTNFFLGLPFEQHTWSLLKTFGEQVELLYWKTTTAHCIYQEDYETAIHKLLTVNRPYAALNLASFCLSVDEESTHLPPQLLVEILASAALVDCSTEKPTPYIGCLEYYVEKFLNIVEMSREIESNEVARLEWMYLPLLIHSERQPKLLHHELSKDPLFFVEVLKVVYRSEDDREEVLELSQPAITRTRLGVKLLQSWHHVPGLTEERTIDLEQLRNWIAVARAAAQEYKRGAIADRQIGNVLAYAPKSLDGIFPDVAVREMIEEIASRELEEGLEIGIYNKRGIHFRSMDDGGLQERQIAATYRTYAAAVRDKHPRTAAMLCRIADSYEFDAHHQDIRSNLVD